MPYTLGLFDFGEDIRIARSPPEQATDLSSDLLGRTGYERHSRPRPRLHTIGSRPDGTGDPMQPQHVQRSRREVLRLGAGLGAGALGAALLAACGGQPPVVVTPSGVVPLRTDVETAAAVTRGGQLRLGARSGGLLPALPPFVDAQLVAVDPRNGVVHADLAERVEMADPQTAVFTLRPELRFHPGTDGLAAALTAFDVLRDFVDRAEAGEFLFSDVVEAIDAPDARTLVLHLRGPFSLLFEFLGDPERGAVRAQTRSATLPRPLGAGPFVPVSSNGDGVVLAANPLYHRAGLPRLGGIAYSAAPDDRALARAFQRGSLDVYRPAGEQEPVTIDERAVLLGRPSHALRGLGLSMLPAKGGKAVRHVEAFQDRRVRRACSLALDRDALLALDGGLASGPVGPAFAADALAPAELAGHPLHQHEPAAARALLEAAGALDLAFHVQTPDVPALRGLGSLIVEQLAAAGFAPRPLVLEPAEWERNFRLGDFEATLFELSDLRTPDLGLRLHTSVGIDGDFSPWGYSNPVYDSAVNDALSEADPSLRANRSREAQRLLLEDVPAMFPLSATVEYALVDARVQGFEWDAYGFNEGWLAAHWSVDGGG